MPSPGEYKYSSACLATDSATASGVAARLRDRNIQELHGTGARRLAVSFNPRRIPVTEKQPEAIGSYPPDAAHEPDDVTLADLDRAARKV